MNLKLKLSHQLAIYSTIVFLIIAGTACSPKSIKASSVKDSSQAVVQKIRFDINEIDENGMIGPADGKRSVAYEFCIPLDKRKRKEISRIDPSVRFFNGPSGRVGCGNDQYLCIGEGATREVLRKLASLVYIKKIEPFYGE